MSILDGMYWETRMKGDSGSDDLLKDHRQRLFNESMPCKDCKINDVCKYCNSIQCFDYDKDVFEIEIKCKKMIK